MLYDGEEIDKPIRDLYIQTFGLLFLRASGVLYTNQTGGHANLRPREEGVFAPLQLIESEQSAITKYFKGRKWRGWCFEGIDEETAQFLDGVFVQSVFLPFLRVDCLRLQNSHEAWIYVRVEEPAGEPELSPFAGFGSCRAVLTWLNSD